MKKNDTQLWLVCSFFFKSVSCENAPRGRGSSCAARVTPCHRRVPTIRSRSGTRTPSPSALNTHDAYVSKAQRLTREITHTFSTVTAAGACTCRPNGLSSVPRTAGACAHGVQPTGVRHSSVNELRTSVFPFFVDFDLPHGRTSRRYHRHCAGCGERATSVTLLSFAWPTTKRLRGHDLSRQTTTDGVKRGCICTFPSVSRAIKRVSCARRSCTFSRRGSRQSTGRSVTTTSRTTTRGRTAHVGAPKTPVKCTTCCDVCVRHVHGHAPHVRPGPGLLVRGGVELVWGSGRRANGAARDNYEMQMTLTSVRSVAAARRGLGRVSRVPCGGCPARPPRSTRGRHDLGWQEACVPGGDLVGAALAAAR